MTRQEQLKADRQARRPGIEKRWNRRRAILLFQREIAAPLSVQTLLRKIQHYRQWCQLDDLLQACPSDIKWQNFARYLLRVIELKEMPYSEYLQTVEWQEVAEDCKRSYNRQCALDATHPAEHAHHRTYTRRGHEELDDLLPLCSDCHARNHGKVTL